MFKYYTENKAKSENNSLLEIIFGDLYKDYK